MKDTKQRLSRLTIFLHWVVGLTIIGLMGVGIYMSQNKAFGLYPIHETIGIILFAFILWRVVWRVINGFPEPVGQYSAIEKILSKVVHWVLIIGTLMYPISGFMMSVMGGHGAGIFIAPNRIDGEFVPLNETLSGIGAQVHQLITPIMIAAIVLHIIGAYKHHIIDKDDTLRRMLGRVK